MKTKLNEMLIAFRANFGQKNKDLLFEEIWDKYYQKLFFYIKSIVKSHEESEDLMQLIMIKIYDNLDNYRPFSSFNAWLYKIAHNCAIDMKRKEKNHCSLEENWSDYTDILPDNNADLKEKEKIINSFWEKLNPRDREVAFLAFYEDLSYKEIEKITEIPLGTIKYIIHEIRKALER